MPRILILKPIEIELFMNTDLWILLIVSFIFVFTAIIGLLDLSGIRPIKEVGAKKWLRRCIIGQVAIIFIGMSNRVLLNEKGMTEQLGELISLIREKDEEAWKIVAIVQLENQDSISTPVDVSISPPSVKLKQNGLIEVDLVIKKDSDGWDYPDLLVSSHGFAPKFIYLNNDYSLSGLTNKYKINIKEDEKLIKIEDIIVLTEIIQPFDPDNAASWKEVSIDTNLVTEGGN